MTLGTRILLALVSVATALTVISVLLQDSSLRSDLQKAARARLERASALASQLLDERLVAQLERYRAISSTPQFLANLEAEHRPTLLHFASELAALHGAESIMFLDREGNELAGSGDEALRTEVHSSMRAAVIRGSAREVVGGRDMSTILALGDSPHTVTVVPIRDESRYLGSLVALEAIGSEEFSTWSTLCNAQVSVGASTPDDPLSLVVRPFGKLQIRISTSFDAERKALANSRRNLLTGGLFGLALASVVSIFLSRSLVRPIRQIQSATERIGEGDLQFRLDTNRGDEVGDVARALNLMLDRLEDNISQRIRVEDQISHLAYHDSLTGLGNRRLLRERLGSALEQSGDEQSSLAVIFLDLDRFKDVNDTLGHTAGDELLIQVAKRLNSCVQTFGIPVGNQEDVVLLARLGGDEFTVLLTDIEDREQIEGLADRILETLAKPFELRGRDVTLSASLGIALSPDDAADVETLLRGSDMAMFHAKNQGGRRYEFYADSMEEIAAKRLALENRLRRALQDDEFELFYQPKINLESNQVAGVEALIRWRDPEHGLVCPDDFIPMAEETGAIIPIGEWVLRKAIEQTLQWQEDGLPTVRIAVNVSVRQIEHRVDFVQQVADLLDETGLDPKFLDLEITEGALLKDEEAAIELFGRLKSLGVGLSLDDFGTGYSSLSYLRRLPIDTLKIDRLFIRGVDSNPEDAALVGSIIAMAKALGLRVVVEGVETRKQRRFLEELGCDEVQGFLFSEPVSAEETAALLRKKRRKTTKNRPAKPTSRQTAAARH